MALERDTLIEVRCVPLVRTKLNKNHKQFQLDVHLKRQRVKAICRIVGDGWTDFRNADLKQSEKDVERTQLKIMTGDGTTVNVGEEDSDR